MIETEIKEMYKSLANGDEWECRCDRLNCIYRNSEYLQCQRCNLQDWQPYKLGEAIRENFEYRKVELWLVLDSELEANKYVCISRSEYETKRTCPKPHFTGSEYECKKWLEEHTKKTWLEETFSTNDCKIKTIANINAMFGATEVCKKILEEIESRKTKGTDCFYCNMLSELRDILRDLGVEI